MTGEKRWSTQRFEVAKSIALLTNYMMSTRLGENPPATQVVAKRFLGVEHDRGYSRKSGVFKSKE